ncbi:MAG: FmdE family protein [Planctomycetota bacterium]
MTESAFPAELEAAVRFHGHLCPGLAIGYRASRVGLDRLGASRAEDEELIAIVENDSCSADGVQWLTGCTFGKGNFFFRDHGKQVFTFALRPSGRAVRVALKPRDRRPAPADDTRAAAVEQMVTAAVDALFEVNELTIDLPPRATIRESVVCDRCGEPVMTSRTRPVGGQTLCLPCADAEDGPPEQHTKNPGRPP